MKSGIIVGFLLSVISATSAVADLQTARHALPDAELVGKGRFQILFWNMFDAALYASHGSWSDEQPFALSLSFHRDLSSDRLVDKSIEQMRQLGVTNEARLSHWSKQLTTILPDVDDGTTITGVVDEDGHTRFYENGNPIGLIRDQAFSKHFLDLWLGEKASLPKLRAQLLGETT